MNPTPSPSPVDVFVHSGPAEWWQIVAALGPLVILVTALIAAYINWRTLTQRTESDKTALKQRREADAKALEQKTTSDNRAEWWRRTEWALERARDNDPETKALGLATLDVLARSELARKEELELFDIAWKAVSAPDENGDTGYGGGLPAGEPAHNEDLVRLGDAVLAEREQRPGAGASGPVDSREDLGDNVGKRNNQDEEA